MEGKRLIILSLDAVGSRDLPFLKSLPHFQAFFARAAVCESVQSVYPSLTYPAHTSIVTGRYPCRHGIVNNVRFQPKRSPSDWFWQRNYIQGTTLYDEAARKGMKVAALLWPVMGKAKISCNLPEVLPNRPWQNQVMVSILNGTPFYELALQRRFGHLRSGVQQPQLDNFVHASMLYTLKKEQPDLMLVHLTDVDTNRHLYGVDCEPVREALKRHDERLGELMETLDQMEWGEDTNVVLLGDHCQMDVDRVIYPNYILYREGWFTVKGDKVTDYRAIARDCDGSCYIYVRDPSDRPAMADLLDHMKQRAGSGIARIFTSKEAAELGADCGCAFMLEAEQGCYFQNGWEIYSQKAEPGHYMENPHNQAATHGYLPHYADYQTIFMAAGPDFLAGSRVEQMSLVDEGPTLARVLGVDLGDTDGRIMQELLKHGCN